MKRLKQELIIVYNATLPGLLREIADLIEEENLVVWEILIDPLYNVDYEEYTARIYLEGYKCV